MTVLDLSHLFRGPYYTPARPGLPNHFKSEIVVDVTALNREARILFDEKWSRVWGRKAASLKAEYTETTLFRAASLVADRLVNNVARKARLNDWIMTLKVFPILEAEQAGLSIKDVQEVIKGLYCDIMDLAEARLRLRAVQKVWTKAAIRKENKARGFHFFDAKTMKANGDTMRNFKAEYSLSKGVYLSRLSNGQHWLFNTETGRLTLEQRNG